MTRATRTLAALVLAVAAVVLAAPGAHAQRFQQGIQPEPQPVRIPGGGTDLFRALLDKEGIQPVTQRDLNNNNVWASDDLIVVVIGSTQPVNWNQDPLGWARKAVQANGAALIASDAGFVSLVRATDFGGIVAADLNGNNVRADWNESHRADPSCPYAVPASPDEYLRNDEKPGPVWGLFRGLTKLATNQPTYIEMRAFGGEFQYPLARFPKSGNVWGNALPRNAYLAVGGDGPRQRFTDRHGYSFLAVADSSIFINQMLMEPTAENLDFALRTVDYLKGPDKSRKRCLFFENGRVVEKFDGLRSALAKPQPKIPPEAMPNVPNVLGKNQDKLIEMADRMVDRLQEDDELHRRLIGPPGSAQERRRFFWLLEGLALVAAYMIWRLLRWSWLAKQPTDVPPAPNTGAGAAKTGPPGVFDRRQKELVRRNNLYEPVRNLMREFFDAVGAPPNPGPKLPPLEISDAVRKPESLRQAIRDMWRIAYGPPQPISAQRWFELEPYFERLRQAHADGKWRFITEEM